MYASLKSENLLLAWEITRQVMNNAGKRSLPGKQKDRSLVSLRLLASVLLNGDQQSSAAHSGDSKQGCRGVLRRLRFFTRCSWRKQLPSSP